jgi:hypothetical protein
VRARTLVVGWAVLGLVAVAVLGACSSDAPTTIEPGTTAVLGGGGGTEPTTSTSMASNSEEGSTGSPGSVAQQRPAPTATTPSG